MQRRTFIAALCLAAVVPAFAADQVVERATPAEAQAHLKKAIAHYKKVGAEKAFADFSKSPGPFVDRDLYVVVVKPDGMCVAHTNPKEVNKNIRDLRDAEGKYFMRERLDEAQTKGSNVQDYVWFNPAQRKMEPKRTYWEKVDNYVFSVGAYTSEKAR